MTAHIYETRLRVSVIGYGYAPAVRASMIDPASDKNYAPDIGPVYEICAGARVTVSEIEDGDEVLCHYMGHDCWIERRYVA